MGRGRGGCGEIRVPRIAQQLWDAQHLWEREERGAAPEQSTEQNESADPGQLCWTMNNQ